MLSSWEIINTARPLLSSFFLIATYLSRDKPSTCCHLSITRFTTKIRISSSMDPQVSTSSGQHSQTTDMSDSGPIDFKQRLLAALNDECEIMDLLSEREPPWGEVVILQFEGIKYVLMRDAEALPRSVDASILLIIHASDSTLAFGFKSSMTRSSIVTFSLNTHRTNDAWP